MRPRGLTGIVAMGTTSLTTKTKCTLYLSRLNSALRTVSVVVINAIEVHRCLVQSRAHVLNGDVFDDDFDLRSVAGKEAFERPFFSLASMVASARRPSRE